jgi:hypothetical protein
VVVVALLALAVFPALVFIVAALWPGSTRSAWGRLGGPAQRVLPVLVVVVLYLVALGLHALLDRDPWRAAVTAGVVLPAAVGAVFLIDATRRHARWTFSGVDAFGVVVALFVLAREEVIGQATEWVVAVVAALVVFLLLGALRRKLRAASYKQDLVVLTGAGLALLWSFHADETWVPRAAAAGAVVLLITLLGVAIAHLVFIGAPAMVIDFHTHCEGEQLTDKQAEQVIEWRQEEPEHRPSWRVRRRANIVFPGAHRPHGPLQQKVSEIFDSDDEPFAKNFLIVTSTADQVTIRARFVTGKEPEPPAYCFTIPL